MKVIRPPPDFSQLAAFLDREDRNLHVRNRIIEPCLRQFLSLALSENEKLGQRRTLTVDNESARWHLVANFGAPQRQGLMTKNRETLGLGLDLHFSRYDLPAGESLSNSFDCCISTHFSIRSRNRDQSDDHQ